MPDADDQPAAGSRRLRGFSVVSGLTLVSRVLGLGRDMLMAGLFGTGWVLDTFTLAFRIPGSFRRLFGEGAMTAAFLPQFVDADQHGGRAAASDLFSAVAWQLTLWLGLLVAIVELGLFGALVLWDLPDRGLLLVQLTMMLLPYSVLICVAALHCAALNGVQHFLVPAMLPVALNILWLGGGLLAMLTMATDADRVRMIAVSVVFGGTLQLGLAVLKTRQFAIRMTLDVISGELRQRVGRLFRQMGPVMFGLSIAQMNGLIDSLLAWLLAQPPGVLLNWLEPFRLAEGTAAALYLGQRMFQFPLGVFGIALGTVLFPRFARHIASSKTEELGRDILHGLQLVLLAGIPASVGLWLMAEPLTDLLFRRGAFGAEDAQLTARMIGAYSLGVWVSCGLLIVNRIFFAAGDQLSPARQGLICVGLNVTLNVSLLPILAETALPVASVLAMLFQLGLALTLLHRRHLTAGYGVFFPVLWRSILAAAVMAGCCVMLQRFLTGDDSTPGRLLRVAIPVGMSVGVYWASLRLTGLVPGRLLAEPFE
ncbi:MAG: murein biosynthesis integral membrane protein MurJ [Fuerstiella sp.]|nr:murein biosynthesis integral membrane protein MurJ [Fuerstiella sp.]